MAKTTKTLSNNEADDHLGKKGRLERDAEKQRLGHTSDVRERKGLPREQPVIPPLVGEDTAVKTLESDEEDHELLVINDRRLIIGLRVYDRNPDGRPIGSPATAEEFVASHRLVRRERAEYRDQGGSKVMAGKEIRERKGKYMATRKEKMRLAPGPLKSIMVRLMPHEATIGGEINDKSVDTAMDRTVGEFAAATGCEVISAVVHRMSGTDLHIHIQYTMVIKQKETKSMLGRRLKPWKEAAAAAARESLAAERVLNPNPSAIGARKKRLIADGILPPEPEAEMEYRQVTGLRSLRDDAILGYSFRQKLNLVRVAEEAGELALAERVTARKDEKGRFRPFAMAADADLEAKYLDLWLERTWRKAIKAELPEETLGKLQVAGVAAAKDYADYGTVMVEETHLERRKADLDAAKAALEDAAVISRQTAESVKLEAEQAVKHVEEMARRRVEASESEARKAVVKMEAAEAAVREKDLELQRIRESAKSAAKSALRQVAAMEEQNVAGKDTIELTTELIRIMELILALPGIEDLCNLVTGLWDRVVALAERVGLPLKRTEEIQQPEIPKPTTEEKATEMEGAEEMD